MQSGRDVLANILDRNYHENPKRYTARSTRFLQMVKEVLPQGWQTRAEGIWCHCLSQANNVPRQGWKIHISAKVSNSAEVLQKSTGVLFARGDANFKFAVDPLSLALLNSKCWSRGGSGKFITVYPASDQQFLDLMDELHQATRDLHGPYILSDYRYQNSGVLFYRYGAMRPSQRVAVTGEMIPVLFQPDGTTIADQRSAYPTTPAWVQAVLPDAPGAEPKRDSYSLRDGRYELDDVLAFSNAGGVYAGTDTATGMRVVVKEARPHINEGLGQDGAMELLKKEFRLLQMVAGLGVAPRPVELFQEWEHLFLVEEYVKGETLANHATRHNILLRTRPARQDVEHWYQGFRSIALGLVTIVEKLHQQGIVFGDLSATNFMVEEDGLSIKIIDFESAHHREIDRPTVICTEGFASRERLSGGAATIADDYYALGAILFSCLMPLNGLLRHKPDFRSELFSSVRKDCGLPEALAEVILQLMADDPASRPSPATLRLAIEKEETPAACERTEKSCDSPRLVVADIVRHIHASASYERSDRLFPGDSAVFSTNPLSFAYGAAGVVHALYQLEGRPPLEAVDWILKHKLSPDCYAPGLYVGLSGIAWVLMEAGAQKEAEDALAIAASHPLKGEQAELFCGLSGYLLASLYFFTQTGNELYLHQARQAGTTLITMSKMNERGRYWQNGREVPLGMAHGASGIGLALLYLYLATGDDVFFLAGREALDFDLSFKVLTKDGGIAWPRAADRRAPIYSYWKRGSAGIGQSLLRFHRVVDDASYAKLLEQIYVDTNREWAAFPGLLNGLTGMGEFLLDLYEVSGERRHLAAASHVAAGVMRFAVPREGTAFCGDRLIRLSCDYGTGSAGNALFLHRLFSQQKGGLHLDSLFAANPRPILQEPALA